jgi:hypothetical protein
MLGTHAAVPSAAYLIDPTGPIKCICASGHGAQDAESNAAPTAGGHGSRVGGIGGGVFPPNGQRLAATTRTLAENS